MRQVVDYCGSKEFGAFGRRAAGFLFRMDRHPQDLIADLLRVISWPIFGCGMGTYLSRGNICMQDLILFRV